MALQPKRPPISIADPTLARVVQDIYGILNEIIEKVNQGTSAPGESKPSDKEGMVRLVKDGADSYLMEVKSQDGWVTSQTGTFTFKEGS